jgi:alginate O-acetyltransferase complex protein AlgI
MIFSTIEYALFFSVIIAGFYIIPAAFRWVWLLLASVFFYGYSRPAYILVPGIITLISYYSGLIIEKAPDEKKSANVFKLAIFLIIGLLVFFKYTNFFTTTLTDLLNFFAGKKTPGTAVQNRWLLDIAAPLGISYITFQAIGYLIEIKRGNHPAEKNIGHLFTFLLFFTKVVAGPVERAHHFLPQLKQKISFSYHNFTTGLQWVVLGLFKKLVIADRLSIYINAVYSNSDKHSGITLFTASILYIFQMYTDFSGYTDMARGFAKMLGIDIMENFNRPFFAKSVTEFWRKWHISLSTWFADYFYNPIAIAKRDWGKWAVVYASFTTFVLLGFWHGANWTFIIFGILQGIILTAEFLTKKQRKKWQKQMPQWLNNWGGILFTIGYFGFSLIFFRSDSVTQAFSIIKKILSFSGPFYFDTASTFLLILLGVFYITLYEVKKEFFNEHFSLSKNKYWIVRNGYYCLLIVIILMTGVFDGGEFIYFQF